MHSMDLLRTLSGCKFHENYVRAQEPAEPPPQPREPKPAQPRPKRRRINRLFRKYCLTTGVLLLGSVVLIVLPLWLVRPTYGKACLLSLPPTLLCALSWAAAAWWAWDRDKGVLMAVTMGAMPVRMMLLLGWAWMVLTLSEIPFFVFVVCLMWHWMLFTVAEIAMLLELSQRRQTGAAPLPQQVPETPVEQVKASDEIRPCVHVPDRRVRQPHRDPGHAELARRGLGQKKAGLEVLR